MEVRDMKKLSVFLFAIVLVFFGSTSAFPAPYYDVTTFDFQPNAINNLGDVVGQNKIYHSSDGTTTYLDTLGGNATHAFDINDSGQVVGWSYDSSGSQHAFIYDGGNMTDLA